MDTAGESLSVSDLGSRGSPGLVHCVVGGGNKLPMEPGVWLQEEVSVGGEGRP